MHQNSIKTRSTKFNTWRKFVLTTLMYLLCTIQGYSDFISVVKADEINNIAEIYIDANEIVVKWEIAPEAAAYFRDIIPEELQPSDLASIEGLNHFRILENGSDLPFTIRMAEKRRKKDRTFGFSPFGVSEYQDVEIIYIEQVFKANGKSKYTIIPPKITGQTFAGTDVGFVCYHNKVPVNDLLYLSKAETLFLNWEDVWFSYFENSTLKRHHKSSLSAYLYVEPFEVRHELLIRLKELENYTEASLETEDYNDPDFKKKLIEIIKGQLSVRINGEAVEMRAERLQYIEVSSFGIQIINNPQDQNYQSVIVGVIFTHPTQKLAKNVVIEYGFFNEMVTEIPTVMTDPAGPLNYIIASPETSLTYINYLKNYKEPTIESFQLVPMKINSASLSIILVFALLIALFFSRRKLSKNNALVLGVLMFLGIGVLLYFDTSLSLPFIKEKKISQDNAKYVIGNMLKNTYRAFDMKSDELIYDNLALNNESELLRQLYLQTKRGLVIDETGGYEVSIERLGIDTTYLASNQDDLGQTYYCRWIAAGRVGHWGHYHNRVNLYEANLSLKPSDDGYWKFYKVDILNEDRLE